MGRFRGLRISKSGGWAEGGAVASEISGAVKTERSWFTGRACVAALSPSSAPFEFSPSSPRSSYES